MHSHRQRPSHALRNQRRRARPRLEGLEDRLVLDTVRWTNPAGGSWGTPSNWSAGRLPGPGDDVILDVPGLVTITHSSGTTSIRSLTSLEDLVLSGGTFTLAAPSALEGPLTLTGGVLEGGEELTTLGPLNWAGGTMRGAGLTRALGGLFLSGPDGKTLEDGRVLENVGNAVWGGGLLRVLTSARLLNAANAVLEVTSDAQMDATFASPGELRNEGTLRKTASSGTTFIGVPWSNAGTFDVQTGTLILNAGGGGTGTFTAARDATLHFRAGTQILGLSSRVTGAGSLLFGGDSFNANLTVGGLYAVSGDTQILPGTTTFLTDATAATLTVSGGTLAGPATFTVSGLLTWTTGAMRGPGRTRALGGLRVISSGGFNAPALDGRLLENAGSALWSGVGGISAANGSVFTNLPGATFTVQADAAFANTVGAASVFNNLGTLRKAGTVGTATLGIGLQNVGRVEVEAGTLALTGGGTYVGAFAITPDATLAFGGFGPTPHTFTASSSIQGAGGVNFTGGTINMQANYSVGGPTVISGATVNFLTNTTLGTVTLSGGALSGPTTVTILGLLTWNGGSMSGAGRTVALGGIALGGGDHGLDSRVLDNAATATWSGGQFSASGNGVWNNLAGSLLLIQSDAPFGGVFGSSGTLQNAGVIRKQTSVGTTSFNVALNNTGTVEVLSGTLSLAAGGTSSGAFTVAQQATLSFRGGAHFLSSSALIQGEGDVAFAPEVFGGVTVTLAGRLSVEGTTTVGGNTNVILLGSAVTANAVQSGGTMGGPADFLVRGQLNWTGGAMAGPGLTRVSGTLLLNNAGGFGNQLLLDGRTLENEGTAVWTQPGPIVANNGAVLHNLAGATFLIRNDTSMFTQGGAASVFRNEGLVRKEISSGITQITIPFENAGTAEALTGNLNLGGGGSGTGVYTAAAPGRVNFTGGTHVLGDGAFLGGSLGTAVTPSGIVSVRGEVLAETFTLAGGTLAGGGVLHVLGTLTWQSGTMGGSGRTVVAAGGQLNLTGAASRLLDLRTLVNFGTMTLGGDLTLTSGASLVNEETGFLDLAGDRTLAATGIATVVVLNRGLLRKSAGPGTAALGGTFTNAGGLEVLSGTLNLTGTFTNFAGGTLAGGAYALLGALRFANARVTRNDANIYLGGPNAQIVDQAGANALATLTSNSPLAGLTLDGGRNLTLAGAFGNAGVVYVGRDSTLTVNGGYSQSQGFTVVDGGTLTAQGGVTIQAGVLTARGVLNGNVRNGGVLDVAGVGVLQINGNYTQEAGGVLYLELGRRDNDEFDRLRISGTAQLDGTLSVALLAGFSARENDRYELVTAAGVAGQFAALDLPNPGGGLVFDPAYGAGFFALTIRRGA